MGLKSIQDDHCNSGHLGWISDPIRYILEEGSTKDYPCQV